MSQHRTLDMEKVRESAEHWGPETIPPMQVAVYVMCGGSFLGRFAATQPADFYIDGRVSKLLFSKAAIEQAVLCLATLAEAHGLDPHNLPEMVSFHNMGVF